LQQSFAQFHCRFAVVFFISGSITIFIFIDIQYSIPDHLRPHAFTLSSNLESNRRAFRFWPDSSK
jgi:hypothetical protein